MSDHYEFFDENDYMKTPTKLGDGLAILRRLKKDPLPEDPCRLRHIFISFAKGFETQAASTQLGQIEANRFLAEQQKKKKGSQKKEYMGKSQEYGVKHLDRCIEEAARKVAAKVEQAVWRELVSISLQLFCPTVKSRKSRSPAKSRSPTKRTPRSLPTLEEQEEDNIPLFLFDDDEELQVLAPEDVSSPFDLSRCLLRLLLRLLLHLRRSERIRRLQSLY